jgi:hypothetical protein
VSSETGLGSFANLARLQHRPGQSPARRPHAASQAPVYGMRATVVDVSIAKYNVKNHKKVLFNKKITLKKNTLKKL